MADIIGQAGANLTVELANYLNTNRGTLTSEGIASIVNQYLVGGDKLAAQGSQVQTGVYRRFLETDIVAGKVEVVTTGLWSGDTGSLNSFYTSSTQNSNYYLNVYNTDPSSSDSATVQFALAYGHRLSSGSVSLSTDDNATLPTKATYAQYRSILLDQDQTQFEYYSPTGSGVYASDEIYVINVSRSRYKEKLDAGNWALTLSGSNGTFTFIDDSGKKFDDKVGKAGRIFYIGEGDLNLGTENSATLTSLTGSNQEGYGLFYPDQGIFILNPAAIHSTVGSNLSVSGSTQVTLSEPYRGTAYEAKNHFLLYNMIDGGGDFEARRTENVSTTHYFVRATNREFNYTNNPTFTTGSDGSFAESSFETEPKTFITTVGLYNNTNELLAVAKTSQPIPKSFDKEVLIKVKLDF